MRRTSLAIGLALAAALPVLSPSPVFAVGTLPTISFAAATAIAGSPTPVDDGSPTVVPDFDADGIPDQVEVVPVGPGNPTPRLAIVFGGRTQSQFVDLPCAIDPAPVTGRRYGDFDGDGAPDLFASCPTRAFLVRGLGSSGVLNAPASLAAPRELSVFGQGRGTIVDADADGYDDVFLDLGLLYRGSAVNLFTRRPDSLDIGFRVVSLRSADLNGDGFRDLAMMSATQSPAFPGPHTHVLLGDGFGGFVRRDAIGFSIGLDVLADVDGDGRLDIGDGTGRWALNLGPGVPPTGTPPPAEDRSYTTSVDVPLSVNVTNSLVAGLPVPQGQSWRVRRVTWPRHGSLLLEQFGGFYYEPDPGFSGTDTFTFVVVDSTTGIYSDPVTATITVAGAPIVPEAPWAVALPIAGLAAAGSWLVLRRRRDAEHVAA